MEQEIWKDIPGYEGKYQASTLGKIKSINYQHTGKEGILKGQHRHGNKNYKALYVDLSTHNNSLKISRLVALTFLGLDIKNKSILVCHKDDDPSNNRLDNLFLGTSQDNSTDMINKNRQGGFLNKGSNNGMSKFSDDVWIKAINLYNEGKKIINISKILGIGCPMLSSVFRGLRRKELFYLIK